ncbi:uncharacterized protein LOC131847855 isoform X4 [Achroia grisella]|nr:uncharacterized protein LOC131847855 isoform X4 [Achroia grisella]
MWEYFEPITKSRQRCLLCGQEICMNMSRHLRCRHPNAYKQYKSEKLRSTSVFVQDTLCHEESVTKYFTKISNARYQCIICSLTLVIPVGLYSNLKTHIETKHPDVFDQSDDENLHTLLDMNNKKLKTRNWVTNYCKKIGLIKYQCLVCNEVLRLRKGHFGNMIRHFKCKHYKIFDKETNKRNVTSRKKGSFRVNNNSSEKDDSTEVSEDNVDVNSSENDTNSSEFPKTTETTITKGVMTKSDGTSPEQNVDETEYVISTESNDVTDEDKVEYIEIDMISESNPDMEQIVSALCEKTVLGRRKNKTCVWNFFKAIDKNRLFACLFCGKTISIFPQSVANLRRHISHVHKKPYDIILKYEKTQENVNVKVPFTEKSDAKDFVNTYFDVEDDGNHNCKICSAVIMTIESDESILFNHIKEDHPDEIMSFVEAPSSSDESLNVIINNFM